ncbi:MAG: zinc ABC transporter substrate-binding protein [Candidatus Gracilibacteria bacterium]|nr:zinc ABC transporter substrate-binding protein [Candidatus Gracilibacteria bacterium]
MKKIIFVLIAILFVSSVFYYGVKEKTPKESGEIKVVTTLFPLYDAAKFIGGEKANVSLLLPPGVEAHSFEPKPSDIVRINEADIFAYTGPFMEVWASDILNGISENVTVVDSSKGATLIEGEEHEHEHGHEDEHADENESDEEHEHEDESTEEIEDIHSDEHDHHGIDPHFWLDFENMKTISSNILEAYISVDPTNEPYYRANFEAYVLQISEIENMYTETLLSCSNKNIVYGGHFAFNYLAKKFSLNYYSAQGFSPDSEPSAKDLIELVELVKQKNVKAIFYEELSSPKIAETIAKETGTSLLLLNGAHNLSKEDLENGVEFFDIMEQNLDNLKVGLNCKNE